MLTAGMSEARGAAPLAKWPFYVADLALSAVLVFVLYRLGPIEGTTDTVIAVAVVFGAAWAAWLSIVPWLNEHRGQIELSESSNLKSSLEQIKSVEKVAELIRQANLQWQTVQDSAGRTVTAAREISDKMKAETEEFMRFLDNAHNSERAGLRLEVEKLRRMEGDWIKVTVGILDHVFAITRAAERSGQQQVITQLQQFQNACRDVARRIGLAPFTPNIGEPFDNRAHQLPDPKFAPPVEARVGEVLATGFTYQGQLLRRSLVMLEGEAPPVSPAAMTGGQTTATESAEPLETQTEPENAENKPADEGGAEPVTQLAGEIQQVSGGIAEAPPSIPEAAAPGAETREASEATQVPLEPENPGRIETVAAELAETEPAQGAAKPARRKRPSSQNELPLA